jgi:hypothetical protein
VPGANDAAGSWCAQMRNKAQGKGREQPMTATALVVQTAPLAGPRKLTPAQMTVDAARCEALFSSSLQRSDAPSADAVAEAITVTVRRFGADGCTGRMAQEFGDHPQAAAARMRWVRSLLTRPEDWSDSEGIQPFCGRRWSRSSWSRSRPLGSAATWFLPGATSPSFPITRDQRVAAAESAAVASIWAVAVPFELGQLVGDPVRRARGGP